MKSNEDLILENDELATETEDLNVKFLAVINALDNLTEACELYGMHDVPEYIRAMDCLKMFSRVDI